MKLDARLKLFVFLAGLFVTSLIVGDLIGGKLYQKEVAGLVLTISVGMIPFPVVFLLTDLINEFYGARAARYVTLVGFAMALFTIGVLQLAAVVPWAPFAREPGYEGMTPAAFENVFSNSQWMLFASTVAYLVAQLIDIAVFHAVKRRLGGRFLWLRATGSTVISQLIDTCVILFIAFGKTLPLSQIASLIGTSYVFKVTVAVALTPLIYAGHALVERGLGLEPARPADS
ncbi:MAG TPA: queuosine precursor transporter [Kofleriaceae bacterium]|nr:queuosine precursor transporter [Kofleriaceae bacterium]